MDDRVIAWSDRLLIGDPLIDAQHRQLVELISHVDERETPDDPQTLAAAVNYAAKHFRDEENLMRQLGYPGLPAQISEHRTLTRTLHAYRKEYEAGHRDLYALKHFLFRWVRDHIMERDAQLGAWLKSRAA